MENPGWSGARRAEQEIRPIIRSLCQGTVAEQQRTLERFFTKDASFVHPFCIAPSFGEGHIPVLSQLTSRHVVKSIFQWYRMLSPKISIDIDAALHDKIRDKMYVDIRQTFSLWFLPMYHAHVRLVTVLDLVASDDADFHDPLDRIIQQDKDKEGDDKSTSQLQQHSHNGDEPRRYKIRRQEDLYQVNDYLKFLGGPGPLPFLWFLFQLQATALCVFMSMFVRLSPWAFQPEPAKGGVEATIERVESYHDDTSEKAEEESPRSHEEGKPEGKPKDKKLEESPPITRGTQDHPENKNGGENKDGPESPSTVKATNGRNNGHNGNNGQSGKNGHNGQHQDDAQHSEQRPNTQEHDTKNGGNNNGGERRDSANSKASPTHSRKKGKKGGNR